MEGGNDRDAVGHQGPRFATLAARRMRAERGFTLIELMVVVLIIGILITIGLPSYLGARERAADRVTQANIRTGLAAALTFFAEIGDFTGFDVVEAETAEPSLDWMSPGPPATDQLDIEFAASTDLLLISVSKTGTFFCVSQTAISPATDRGMGAQFADVDTIPECTGGW